VSRRLPRGITHTPTGWRISVRVKGRPRWSKRFARHVPLDAVAAELATAKRALRAGRLTSAPGTFAHDISRYLADYFTGRPGYEERARHLALWQTALGPDIWRHQVTRDEIARTLNAWRASGLAADTCNKRRTALLALYHALDGKGGLNPVREIPKFRSPDPLPRGLPYAQIEAALAELPRCKTRARLTVMAYTGLRQGQVMALRQEHWDRPGRHLMVPGTEKGRGTKPYGLPLSLPAHQALLELDKLEAWGRFTWAPMARMWKAAATRAKLPAGTVPYDLRHSFGTAMYQATGDPKVTKELMGHSALRMTERYTVAAVPERQSRAMRAFEAFVRVRRKAAARGVGRRPSTKGGA
jgi:integrase